MNQKWPKSDFFGLKLILKTFHENFKKYSLESVETFFQVRNSILMYFWPKNFQKIFNISKFESKVAQKWLFRPKTDSKHFSWKFQKELVTISWNFVCKSEIAFWCTFDQKISKTFQYFKVWIKSGLKVTFLA